MGKVGIAQQVSVLENSPTVPGGSRSSWSTGIDQKLTGLIRYGNLRLGLPGNLCLKIVLLIIDSVKCRRHKSRNINSNSMFIVLTMKYCHQDYVF